MLKDLTGFEWNPDTLGCGDPRIIEASISNWFSHFGLEFGVTVSAMFYLTPLLAISIVACVASVALRRKLLIRWPDLFLLVLPVLIWFALIVSFPVGKKPMNFSELLVLGTFSSLTIVARWPMPDSFRTQLAGVGLLGTTSLAACLWAFVPAINS